MKLATLMLACLAFATPTMAKETVLARNAWTTVTTADFESEVERIPPAERHTFLASAERVARTVEGILVNKTLAAQARSDKLDSNPVVVAEIANTVDRVLARHRVLDFEAKLKMPDFTKRAEELYKANPAKYAEKDAVHTMHILVDTKCRTLDAAKERALEVRALLVQGQAFAEVARKYSDDPTVAKNSGDAGPMIIDNLSPTFAEAVKTMKPGDLSQPVLSNFGYHIIKLESIRKGRQFRLQEIQQGIVNELKEAWITQQKKEFIEKITADPALKLDLDAIQALKTNLNVPAPEPQPKRPG